MARKKYEVCRNIMPEFDTKDLGSLKHFWAWRLQDHMLYILFRGIRQRYTIGNEVNLLVSYASRFQTLPMQCVVNLFM